MIVKIINVLRNKSQASLVFYFKENLFIIIIVQVIELIVIQTGQ